MRSTGVIAMRTRMIPEGARPGNTSGRRRAGAMAGVADARPPAWRTAAQLLVELAAFAALLFLTRFVLRGYLALPLDEECHIGGIALDDFKSLNKSLLRLERFWTDQILYRL